MVLDLSRTRLDVDKLDNGVWWHIRMQSDRSLTGEAVDKPDPDQPAVLLVPIGDGYERQFEKEREPYLAQLRDPSLTDAERNQLLTEYGGRTVAKKVLRGWQNLTFGGDVTPWSEEKAIEVLTDREYENLLHFCVQRAANRQAARVREEAEAAGN